MKYASFKNESQQRLYEVCREGARDTGGEFYNANGSPNRGAGHLNAYWMGRDGHPTRYLRGSLAYAAWAAGRDDRRASEKVKPLIAVLAFILLATPAFAEHIEPTPRMPAEQSEAIKRSMLPPGGRMRDYELDHIIPLCMGGSNDRSNLQLQPWPVARQKDADEGRLCKMLDHDQISKDEAWRQMREWRP